MTVLNLYRIPSMETNTQRLDKYLSHLGICSRRNVGKLLKEKNVTVNGTSVTEPGLRIDPEKDDIRLDGTKLKLSKLVYYLVNKPKGIISTVSDEFGRRNVTSLVPKTQRLYPVGRLDKDTTGLILLTNDGELTNLLTHPRYHVEKVYRLTIKGKINKNQLNAFQNGVQLHDGKTAPSEVHIVNERRTTSLIEITLHEGKNRQIRRMCEKVKLPLLELTRIRLGPLVINNLKEGKYRELSHKEVQMLKKSSQDF